MKNKYILISIFIIIILSIWAITKDKKSPIIQNQIETQMFEGNSLFEYKKPLSERLSKDQLEGWEIIPNMDLLFGKSVTEFYINFNNDTNYKIKRAVNFIEGNCSPESCEWVGNIIENKCNPTIKNTTEGCRQVHLIIRDNKIMAGTIPGDYKRYNRNYIYQLKINPKYENTLLVSIDQSNMKID